MVGTTSSSVARMGGSKNVALGPPLKNSIQKTTHWWKGWKGARKLKEDALVALTVSSKRVRTLIAF